MNSILPHCNFSDKAKLIDLLETVGAPTEGFIARDGAVGMAFLELYITQILPNLNNDQRIQLANELVAKSGIDTPYTYSWNPTKAEVRAQKQLEMDSWDQMFELLAKYKLAPSGYLYSRFLWDLRNRSLIPEYFERLWKAGVVLDSDSVECNNTWNLLLDQCANKEAVAGAQWLIDHKIWPTTHGVQPVYNTTAREDDTIFSWVRHKKGVAVLRQLPEERLKASMNHCNGLGRTPLHHATANLIPEMVEFLLELGAHKTPKDHKGKYPLDLIRKTTSRVEHISAIQNMLGGATSKTSDEILSDAIKKFDTAFLSKALKDPKILARKNEIVFEVLAHGIGNSTPSVYKKMRKRKMDMFLVLLENSPLNYQNSNGDTFLHAAIQSGLLPAVQYLLERDPQLAHKSNCTGALAADMVINEFDTLAEYQYGVYTSHFEYTAHMQRDTSQKILKIYQKHKIDLQPSNFPALLEDPNWRALLSKIQLEKALENTEQVQSSKRKI